MHGIRLDITHYSIVLNYGIDQNSFQKVKLLKDCMFTIFKFDKIRFLIIFEVFLVLSGIGVFAWFIHGEHHLFFIALGGITISSLIISLTITRSASILTLLGLDRFDKRILVLSFAAVIVGVIISVLYRKAVELPVFPRTFTKVAVISPMIGITEELIFRGYIQGRMKTIGIFTAVLLAAATHSLYKYLVLKSLPVNIGIDFPWLVFSTFMMGLILGASREITGSIIPAMAWHAVFDIMFYGDFSEMPLWVWS